MGEEATTNNLNLKMLCGININSEVSTFVSGTPYAIPYSNKWNKNLSIVEKNFTIPSRNVVYLEMRYATIR